MPRSNQSAVRDVTDDRLIMPIIFLLGPPAYQVMKFMSKVHAILVGGHKEPLKFVHL